MNRSTHRRVVITGYGAICALGSNVSDIWSAVMNYQTGYHYQDFGNPNISARYFGFIKEKPKFKNIPKPVLKFLPEFARLSFFAASEAVQIPYRDPLTGRSTIYVPDFFIQYVDKLGEMHVELIEIKPASQQLLERVGKNKYNQAQFVKNQAKWQAANIWCKQQGIKFRIVSENDLFHNGSA